MTKTGFVICVIIWSLGWLWIGTAINTSFDPFKDHVKGVVVYNATSKDVNLVCVDSAYGGTISVYETRGKDISVLDNTTVRAGEVRRVR